MYVRLKHTLSAVALAALRDPARSSQAGPVPWLRAFCELAGQDGGTVYEVPMAAAAGRAQASRRGVRSSGARASEARGLEAVLASGLLERTDGALVLPAAFRPYMAYLTRQVHRLDRALRSLAGRPPLAGRRGIIRKGAALFNAGLFFECHEYLEDAWRRASGDDRILYHGWILVAASFYHHEKGNLHGARIKLTEGMKHLQRAASSSSGLMLREWLQALAPWRKRLEAGHISGVLQASEIPRLPLSPRRRRLDRRPRGS